MIDKIDKAEIKRVIYELWIRLEEDSFYLNEDEIRFVSHNKRGIRTMHTIKITKTEKDIDYTSFDLIDGYLKWKKETSI